MATGLCVDYTKDTENKHCCAFPVSESTFSQEPQEATTSASTLHSEPPTGPAAYDSRQDEPPPTSALFPSFLSDVDSILCTVRTLLMRGRGGKRARNTGCGSTRVQAEASGPEFQASLVYIVLAYTVSSKSGGGIQGRPGKLEE